MTTYPAAFDPVPINPQIPPTLPTPSDPFSQVAQVAEQQQQASTQTVPVKTYKYYPAPPVISTYHQYQDVNNDPNLQHTETLYFLDKTLEWIKYDKSYKKLKKFERYLKGPNGYEIIHKILKLFVRRGNTNWYDLKVQQSLVKDYIKHKLSKI